jgi:hypothetical protein
MARLNELVRNQGAIAPGEGAVSFKDLPAAPVKATGEQPAQWVQEADECYARAKRELAAIGAAVRTAHAFSLEGPTQVAEAIVASLAHGDRLLVKAISGQPGDLLVSNLINTAILSIKLAKGLQYSREDLCRLGLAALLHDVGMWMVPDALLTKSGALSSEERTLLKRHPEVGAQAIRRLGPDAEWLAEIVYQEHERFDGRGYPRGIKGGEIHEYAQIIGLADILDALLTTRPYRRRFLPHEAVREVVTREKAAFSTRVLKCLIQQFSVYPLGTRVRLNSGETGEVTELNPHSPLRPVVRVYLDASHVPLREPRIQDLSKTSLVHITEVVQEDQG